MSRILSLLLLLFLLCPAPDVQAQAAPITTDHLLGLPMRSIGPAVTGGRIHDVEALPTDPATVYVATASGGLWKSVNKGTTWAPIFEGQAVSTFGDLALAASDPNVVWAGTGEQNNRQSTSWGNGVYRSTDAGATWTHLGLEATRHIGRIQVHPADPEVAYVAALGNLWAANPERGVFKTTDGGQTWDHVLFLGEDTGVVDLVMDPTAPEVLIAAAYQRRRRTWGFNGGGPAAGLFRTTDGGMTWHRLETGLPMGDYGRIGLAQCPSRPATVYASVEHASEAGVYRSIDGGDSWARVNTLNPRPMYYSHLVCDPHDPDRVYMLATEFYRSDDGGTTFRQMPTRPTYDVGVHSDHHTLWIDPTNTRHLYLAGDAGLHESWDAGETFLRINNLPIAQFYGIGLDMRRPYHIYGGMQDNHSWEGPSATRRWIGIINDDWNQVGFGDGMYQQPDPTNPRIVYNNSQNGGLQRLDIATGDMLDLRPYPEEEGETYRWDWVTPILVSQHNPNTVYFGGHRLFMSYDYGNSWSRTKDLTRAIDRDTLQIMGVAGRDTKLSRNDGTASYGEIVTLAESPRTPEVLWVGTDDGNVQVSRDAGRTWTEVSGRVPGLPGGTYVSRVVASTTAEGTAYATFDAHRDGDFRPFVYRTTDYGATWVPLHAGLPEMGSVNVLVEHPGNPNLLFVGTEHALFVSTDRGRQWAQVPGVPTTHYDDLKIHPRDDDLVMGTHGRSLWIWDDLTPLAEWEAAALAAPAHLFTPRAATYFHYWKATSYRGQGAYAGENEPFGALLHYHLAAPQDSVRLVLRDAAGAVVRTLDAPGEAGRIHRVRWDLRYAPPPYAPSVTAREGLVRTEYTASIPAHPLTPQGPFVVPGTYTVTLEAGSHTAVQTVTVRADPEMPLTAAQHADRVAFATRVLAHQRTAFEAAQAAARLRDTLAAQQDALDDAPAALTERVNAARALAAQLSRTRGQLYSLAGAFNGQGVRQGTLYPPTATHHQRLERLEASLVAQQAELNALAATGAH